MGRVEGPRSRAMRRAHQERRIVRIARRASAWKAGHPQSAPAARADRFRSEAASCQTKGLCLELESLERGCFALLQRRLVHAGGKLLREHGCRLGRRLAQAMSARTPPPGRLARIREPVEDV